MKLIPVYKTYHFPTPQDGFTLVELMISALLSLIIITGVTTVYIANKKTALFQQSLVQLQDKGQFALLNLRKHIRQAGACNSNLTATKPLPCSYDAWYPLLGSEGSSDQIQVRYQSTGSAMDCLGNTVAKNSLIRNTYMVKTERLLCNGQVLLDGVENLQILYGFDQNGDKIADTYLDASEINWSSNSRQVVNVWIALLLRGDNPVKDSAESQTYQLTNISITSPSDRFLRQVFSTTIALRNAVI